jgi:hypothetical protein
VAPFSISEHWNVISRTILPVISQDDVIPGESESGIGDITQSLFFSPKKPTASGWIWGAGPAFLLPTSSDDVLGTEKWGIGPTAVVLKQTDDGWTYGALVNHIVSVAGDDDRVEAAAAVAGVAERFRLRLPATAEGDHRAPAQAKGFPFTIDDFQRLARSHFDPQRSAIPHHDFHDAKPSTSSGSLPASTGRASRARPPPLPGSARFDSDCRS